VDSNIQLGKLERVNVRDVWKGEAQDFTPWLCQPENMSILSDAVGLDLEVQKTEFRIGEFRLDILATVKGTEEAVVIENQFWKTDHTHLGQLLTYAAGVGQGGGAKTWGQVSPWSIFKSRVASWNLHFTSQSKNAEHVRREVIVCANSWNHSPTVRRKR
jgi:hypothetical protein